MKKIFALIMLVALALLLVACGESSTPPTPPEKPRTPIVRGDTAVVFGTSDSFDVVYPTDSADGKALAESIAAAVTGLKLKTPEVKADGDKTEGQCELVIGDTTRALSAEAKALVEAELAKEPNSAHWAWLYKDGQVALYANTPFAYENAIAEISSKYYKAGEVQFKTTAKNIGFIKILVPVVEDDLVYLFGSTDDFSVVYGAADASGQSLATANALVEALKALDVNVPDAIADADKTETLCEILVGDTGRELSNVAKELAASKKSTLSRDAWVWIYRDGKLAIYASNPPAYEAVVEEFCKMYCSNGTVKVPVDVELDGGSIVHDAYMSYESYNNFYDGYADPFGMNDEDYKQMTVTRTRTAYEISYVDEHGGNFITTFVERGWGIWAMGGMTYREADGKRHDMVPDNTDSEFVLRIGAKTPVTLRSGNHGNYPGDTSWEPYKVDNTSMYNDTMLDMTLYDAKTGKQINLPKVGNSITVSGLRIVMHHNIYEINYTQSNVLANAERSYLYNGYDVMCDTKLYMAQDVKLANSFSCMLPVNKPYGNCAMFYATDGSTVFMRTPDKADVSLPEMSMGVKADYIDIWGENNSALHIKIKLNNIDDQLRNSTEGSEEAGYTGIRNMPGSNGMGSATNKIYCSCFSATGEMDKGESLNFSSCWSFSYEPDFVAPDRAPDRTVGYD